MVRAKAMASKPRPAVLPGGPPALYDRSRPWRPEGQPWSQERLEALLARAPERMSSPVGRRCAEVAAQLVVRRPWATEPTLGADEDRHTIVARCLLEDAEIHGGDVEPRRAFLPEQLRDYLERHASTWSQPTTNTRSTYLHQVARYLHPDLYPKQAAPYTVGRSSKHVPSERDVQRWYGIAHLVSGNVGRRFGVMLDLGTHVGTTSREALELTGTCVQPHGWHAVVTIHPPAGSAHRRGCETRRVPIGDPRAARRLLDAAALAGDGPILGIEGKNALSNVPWALRSRGHEVQVTMEQLRAVWIRRMLVSPIPTKALWQIAGLSVSDGLKIHIPHCPKFTDTELVHLICATQEA
ncbi:hypothetical protein [Dietzia sp. 179-F 9C3 NHS]|uniref:hypothetical protein n=1 Tax=Dietzia sp. 179-F 9C3 NHS TaxID=3374295 RepID=UPI00387A3AD8